MKKILYITHVAWGWIKQRPQFLAEELSKDFVVDVLYTKSNRFHKANREFINGNLNVHGFRFLPLERITFIPISWSDYINKALFAINSIDFSKYDIIWTTDPRTFFYLDGKIHSGQMLVYDCMDDMVEFPYCKRYPKLASYMEEAERELLERADVILFSAETLKQKLLNRYGIQRTSFVVNNAISDDIVRYKSNIEKESKNTLAYIGTISGWFDFDTVISSLESHKDLIVELYGPIRMQNQTPRHHPRLIYKGAIEHSTILSVMKSVAGLIMPFQLNNLVLSVNPVKLYEYIYSGKPICAVRYDETEKFRNYVSLYSSQKEFDKFVEDVMSGNYKTDMNQMQSFALSNTWKNRAHQIKDIIS